MLLEEIISSLHQLGAPRVFLDEQGLRLVYNTKQAIQIKESNQSLIAELRLLVTWNAIIVPHRLIELFLLRLGACKMGLNDAIELYYLNNERDRSQFIAQASLIRNSSDILMSQELFSFGQVTLGPRPHQLIAEINIRIPEPKIDEFTDPSRVVFLLDRSGSMKNDERINYLKEAVIHAIKQLNPETLVSVYFYNSSVENILLNKAKHNITELDLNNINAVEADGGTNMTEAVKSLVCDLRVIGVLNNPQQFDNVTVVWLTDGEDQEIKSSEALVNLFLENDCPALPLLIAVGMGDYNQVFLNSVAEDVRFKSNLMIHIKQPEDSIKLFNAIARCVGVMRKKVLLVLEDEGIMTYQDLGIMQAGQTKEIVMEVPLPLSGSILCRLILDNQVYWRDEVLAYNHQNIPLLIKYFNQLHTKIILARQNNQAVAEDMQVFARNSIPSTIHDPQLQSIRLSFMKSKPTYSLIEEDLKTSSRQTLWKKPRGYQPTLFTSPDAQNILQEDYSQSLQQTYSNHKSITS